MTASANWTEAIPGIDALTDPQGSVWTLKPETLEVMKDGGPYGRLYGTLLTCNWPWLYVLGTDHIWYEMDPATGALKSLAGDPESSGTPPPAPAPAPTPAPVPTPPPPAPAPTPAPSPAPTPPLSYQQIADPAMLVETRRQADSMAANAQAVSTVTQNVLYARHAVWMEFANSAVRAGAANAAVLADEMADAYFQRFTAAN